MLPASSLAAANHLVGVILVDDVEILQRLLVDLFGALLLGFIRHCLPLSWLVDDELVMFAAKAA